MFWRGSFESIPGKLSCLQASIFPYEKSYKLLTRWNRLRIERQTRAERAFGLSASVQFEHCRAFVVLRLAQVRRAFGNQLEVLETLAPLTAAKLRPRHHQTRFYVVRMAVQKRSQDLNDKGPVSIGAGTLRAPKS